MGSDNATIQDALADANEHLTTALASLRESRPDLDETDALEQIIQQYGTPEETATAYVEVERRTFPGLVPAGANKPRSPLGRFFGIYADPRAWGSLFYMLVAFVTGVGYLCWAVTGLSISITFAIFIFGLPVMLLFLLSVRGIAWLEGRLVEALLGVRMPRRPLFESKNVKWMERLKLLLKDKHTWFSLLYMLLQFVLGMIYFVGFVFLFAFSLAFITTPLRVLGFNIPIAYINGMEYFTPVPFLPLEVLAGILLWTVTMHLVKWVGGLHGRYAKALLVSG
jgi:hypothetical protein